MRKRFFVKIIYCMCSTYAYVYVYLFVYVYVYAHLYVYVYVGCEQDQFIIRIGSRSLCTRSDYLPLF